MFRRVFAKDLHNGIADIRFYEIDLHIIEPNFRFLYLVGIRIITFICDKSYKLVDHFGTCFGVTKV